MSDTVIKAEKLGKKYIISHETEQLSAFQDVIRNQAAGLFARKSQYRKEEFWALKDIYFEVKQGEVFGIIGRNGGGKSTLLKILSRITEPSQGRVEITGRTAALLEVGTGFHPELTGRENIFLNGAILGMSRAEIRKKFDAIVDFSGVEKFLDTPVKHYSSGMYLRLAFAVAAHLEPEILIVDEVLAVGDAEFQKKCLGKMDEVSKKEGRTVLFVSHNLDAIQSLCSKGLLLQNGSLLFSGEIEKAVHQYTAGRLVVEAEKRWTFEEAPGNEKARLLHARVCDGVTGRTHEFNTANGFVLELEVLILSKEKELLDISFYLADEKGTLVTVSSSIYTSAPGYYGAEKINVRAGFPGGILNEGIYTFSRILLVRDRERVITEWNDVVSFKIVSPPSSVLEGWSEKEGIVKINNLSWEIRRTTDQK